MIVQLCEAAGGRETQYAARVQRACAQSGTAGIDLSQNLSRIGQERRTLLTDRDFPRGAMQKFSAQLPLQLSKAVAGHGGGEAKIAASGGDVQPLGGGDEKAKGIRVHTFNYTNKKNSEAKKRMFL